MKMFLFLVFSFPFLLMGQAIPDERTVDWSVAGAEATFPDPENAVNVMDFGAQGYGLTNDAPAIQAAINDFGGEAGVVLLPAGHYLLEEPVTIPSGIVVRGIDSLSTRLIIDLDGEPIHALRFAGSAGSEFVSVVSGYSKGSQTLVVDDASIFSEGDYVELLQDNGDWDTEPASWAEESVGQIAKVVQVVGNTLELHRPLRITFSEALSPRIRTINPVTNAAIENVGIERMDQPAEGAGSNIHISFGANIRIRNIESNKSVGSHIGVYRSTQVLVEGSYIHHAFTYDGSGTRGYGITLNAHSGECLIENNVFEHLRHAMMVKTGANGNVFGYNYSIDPYRSENIHDFSGDIALHGHYAFANLFEGNQVQNIVVDHYWGPSGPLNTFFRNRAELYGFMITSSDNPSDTQNIVGLEITNTGFFYGLYTINGENHFEYGNYVTGEILPYPTDLMADASYYLNSPPDFWVPGLPWPCIGIPLPAGEWDIPAKLRYLGIDTESTMPLKDIIEVYPNPAAEQVFIRGISEGQHFQAILYDLSGKVVLQQSRIPVLDVSHLVPGTYVLSLRTGNTILTKKILVSNH